MRARSSRGDLRGRAEQLPRRGHVEERLVERQRLDQRRHRLQDLEHARADVGVGVVPRRHDDRVGRHLQRARHRHRAAHAERPHLVRRRQHHAAPGVAAHDHRPAAQGRVVALLDGRVERVHVHVQDRTRVGRATRRRLLPPTSSPRGGCSSSLSTLRLRFGGGGASASSAVATSVPPIVTAKTAETLMYWSTAPPAVKLLPGAAGAGLVAAVDQRAVHGRRSSSSTRSSAGSRPPARASNIGVIR